jgi:hypothetical protein
MQNFTYNFKGEYLLNKVSTTIETKYLDFRPTIAKAKYICYIVLLCGLALTLSDIPHLKYRFFHSSVNVNV